jgi:signal peptidase I
MEEPIQSEAQAAPAPEPPVPESSPHKKRFSSLFIWARDLGVAVALAAFFVIFLYQPVKVEGTSMLPGLEDQERIFINKFVYKFEAVTRGDVIVFHYPYDLSKSYIKRVIAVPGDRVRIDQGEVFVNGERVSEPYVPARFEDDRSMPELTVPEDSFFVLGDHRSMSNDSRDFGAVRRDYIFGKAVLIYWPVEKLGLLH